MGTTRTTKKSLRSLLILTSFALALTMAFTTIGGASVRANEANLQYNGKFYSTYSTLAEAQTAAAKLNLELAGEGMTLLKNDGSLPLPEGAKVSIFGGLQSNLFHSPNARSGDTTVAQSLTRAGFQVNQTLLSAYSGSNTVGTEKLDFTAAVQSSFGMFNDAAVVMFQRGSHSEGADMQVNALAATWAFGNNNTTGITAAVVDEEEYEAQFGWSHEDLGRNRNGESNRHWLMLTESEDALIDYVTARFKNVIVLINNHRTMELYNLQQNPAVSAILQIGSVGENGIQVLGDILRGKLNPSGKTSAQYYRDFTADPVWKNAGTNRQHAFEDYTPEWWKANGTDTYGSNADLKLNANQVVGENIAYYETGKHRTGSYGTGGNSGLHMIDQEEGIYMGFKYYETYWNEIANGNTKLSVNAGVWSQANQDAADEWHNFNVVYPFGYGLSYTKFDFAIQGVYTDKALKNALPATVNGDIFASSLGSPADVKTLYVPVTVTNTGGVAGKEVVEIYITAPYIKNGVEKAFVTLAGFEKTNLLRAGGSQTLTVAIDVQDFASFDFDGRSTADKAGYILDEGEYIIRAMNSSSVLRSSAYDDFTFEINNAAHKAILLELDDFSGNVITPVFSTPGNRYYSIRDGINADPTVKMTQFSRADMDGTFPKPPTKADLTLKDSVIQGLKLSHNSRIDDDVATLNDKSTDAWWIAQATLDTKMANWSQVASATGRNTYADILLADMSGVPMFGADGEVHEDWVAFLNQLTFEEIRAQVHNQGSGMKPGGALDYVQKQTPSSADSPANLNSLFNWVCGPTIAATWNKELAKQQGTMNGDMALLRNSALSDWYGPGININRSPFSGRTKDYYSQDGMLAGLIGAEVTKGAQSKGLNVIVKHFAFNDQDDRRNGAGTSVFMTEQAAREIYLRGFQKALQEGGAGGLMTSFSSIGTGASKNCPTNHALMTQIVKQQWGWYGLGVNDANPGYTAGAYTQINTTDPISAWATSQGWTVGGAGANAKASYNWPAGNTLSMDMMVRAGNALPINAITNGANGASNPSSLSGEWNQALRSGKGSVEFAGGVQSDLQYYYIRMAVLEVFYENANSMAARNGVWLGEFVAKGSASAPITLTQGTAVSAVANTELSAQTIDLRGSTARFTVSSGTLPTGLTLNATTGAITGTPTAATSGNVTVGITVTIDGYRTKAVNYIIRVNGVVAYDGDTSGTVGKAFSGSVSAEAISGTKTYSATGLPAGLTMASNGTLSGTPTAAGTFNATLNCAVGSTTYTYALTIVIAPQVFLTAEQVQNLIDAAIAGFIKADDVDAIVAAAGYLKTADVNALITAATTGFLKAADIDAIVAAAGYLKEAQVTTLINTIVNAKGYQTETQVNALIAAATSGFLTEEQVDALIGGKGFQTVTQVNALITAATSGFLTETTATTLINNIINSKGFQTAENVNTIINGKGFLTSTQVQELIDLAVDGLQNETEVNALIAAATSGFLTETQINTLINGKGFQTAAQVNTIVDAAVAGKITEAKAQELIDAAVTGKLNETQVKALVDAAIKEYDENKGGCDSAIGADGGIGLLAIFGLLLAGAVVIILKRRTVKD